MWPTYLTDLIKHVFLSCIFCNSISCVIRNIVSTKITKKKLCPYFCVFYIRCAEKLSLQIPFLWEIGQLRLEDRSKFSIGDGIGEESSMDSIISSWVIARDGEGMVVWLLLSMIDLKGLCSRWFSGWIILMGN